MFQLWINQIVGFYYQNVWKTPVESDILSRDAGHRPAYLLKNVSRPQVFFKHFGSKNQPPGFYISRKLVENGLKHLE